MPHRLVDSTASAMRWYFVSLVWVLLISACGVLILFRAIKTSAIAQMFQFDDVPLLRFTDLHYATIYWSTVALAVGFSLTLAFVGIGWFNRRTGALLSQHPGNVLSHPARYAGMTWMASTLLALFTLAASRYSGHGQVSPEVHPIGAMDWAVVALAGLSGWLLTRMISARFYESASANDVADVATWSRPFKGEHRGDYTWPLLGRRTWKETLDTAAARLAGLGVVYLLGCAAVFYYAIREHAKFWDSEANGGYDYAQFFLPDEIRSAHFVLYSTSLLFASIAALAGCACFLLVRWTTPESNSEGPSPGDARGVRHQAILLAVLLAIVIGVPWQVKALPELRAENGWIFPAVVLMFSTVGLAPLLLVSGLSLRRDFRDGCTTIRYVGYVRETKFSARRYPRSSEFALWTLFLFPVYPFWHFLRWRCRFFRWLPSAVNYICLMSLVAAGIVVSLWMVNTVDEWFDFEDWRGMLRAGQFPFLRVFFSLLAAGWIYLAGRRVLNPLAGILGPLPRLFRWPSRIALAGGMAACLVAAAWPFWGWSGVRQNVFARAFEFNSRHEFELGFLHWVFDLDRDSYSALLHGADADDFNAAIQAGGIGAAETVEVAIDRFEVVEPKKARDFPNVLLLYLEGVVPRSISAYGQRDLPGGLKATPHIDSIAEEGIRFNACRCFYPSTWDAWFAVNSGRFLRVSEMDASIDFEDRYTRYNNLYKVLKLAGVNRWCHAECSAYAELFVPPDLRSSAWMPHEEFDADISAEEEAQGVKRGDKLTQRILEFIDDLKADEKFFICEHMTDTHFPWTTTSAKRAAELGFPDGLEIYQQDARLPNGDIYAKYSAYYETITRMDAQIGLILDKLKRRGLYENTMVIIISDHGCQWWEHEHLYYVAHLYEQCLRVPFVIKAPGLPAGQVSDAPVLQQDILPTVMELAGIRLANPGDGVPMPCRSLVPLMRGTPSQLELQGYRRRDVPLTTHYDQLGVISNFQHKLIFDRPSGTYLLFSLKDDPGELHNLVDERPDLKEALLAKLRVLLNRHKVIIGQIKRSDP